MPGPRIYAPIMSFLPASTEDAEMIGEEVEFYFLFTVGDAKGFHTKTGIATGSYPMIEHEPECDFCQECSGVVVVDSNRIVFEENTNWTATMII